jgi:hypothetical protein
LADIVASAPLGAHAVALLVLLLLLLPFVGTDTSYSADEGAAIIQAQSLADGDGWIIPHPLPEVDPRDALYPYELSPSGPKGVASYAKHPAYPWVLAGADRVGGHIAMVLLSLFGTWAAALGAACLARSLVGGYGRTVLWLVGAGSPLLFDGYWVIAHSLAAAALVWAVHLALRLDRTRRSWLIVPVILGLVVAASLLRTEVVLYAVGLGSAIAAIGVLERHRVILASGIGMAVASLLVRRVDAALVERIVGAPVSSTGAFAARESGDGALAQRWDGFVATWVRPGPAGDGRFTVVAVVVATLLVVMAAVALRRARPDLALASAVLAAGLLVVRALVLPEAPIPALLVAFPILAFGGVALLSLRWALGRRALVVAAGLGLAWAGVLATQYAEGGVAEWGGRYFAAGIPIAAPILVAATADLTDRARGSQAVGLRWALAVGAAALSVASLRELREVHATTATSLDRIADLASAAGPAPVIVTDESSIPRLDWAAVDRHRWLLVDPAADPTLPSRLADAGVERWVLVSADVDGAVRAFDGVTVVEKASPFIVLVQTT